MNDRFLRSDREEDIARKLSQVAEQTNANGQFAAELEEKLRNRRQPKTSWFAATFRQISPAARWVALMLLLGLALSLSIKTLIPAPQPAVNDTPGIADVPTPTPGALVDPTATPVTDSEGFDWRGAKLYLAAPLPESPAEANVYLLQADQRATVEEARALAQQFGIEGQLYEAPGQLPNTTDYMITDGRQRLYVRSMNYFTYYANYSQNIALLGSQDLSDEEAYAIIDSFLKSHGFDFEYRIEKDDQTPGVYNAVRLTPDGYGIRFDYNMPSRLQVTLGSDGQVIFVDSSQINYELAGTYGIRSAEEAFQQVLGAAVSSQSGIMESARSGGVLNENYWERSYPDNQTVTIYGRVTSFESVEPGKPPFVAIGIFTATGNPPLATSDQLVAATGRFYTENGIRKFNVESWQPTDVTETSVMGTLQREGDQTVLVSDMGDKYAIADAPADVPLNTVPPDEQILVNGFLVDENLLWTSIQYFPAGSNYGGGGGGGTGFFQLNLSGPPVPFLTPTTQPETGQGESEHVVQEGDTCAGIASSFGVSIQSLIDANHLSAECVIAVGQGLTIPGAAQGSLVGRQLEKQRGTLSINLYQNADGTSRPEFVFVTTVEDTILYATLENVSLEEMLPHHNRPVEIWGAVKTVDAYGTAVISVDRAEAPYPGLEFQILRGTQRQTEIDGYPVILLTTREGASYVQKTRDNILDMSIVGEPGDEVIVEALIIPDETFGGYPVMQVFSVGMATNPKNGEPTSMEITADKPHVMDASLDPQAYLPPDSTIERVELVYYIPDPRYAVPDPNAGPQYIQPAWRFAGRYSNGDVFEILVQALKQEYLLPELETYTPPG